MFKKVKGAFICILFVFYTGLLCSYEMTFKLSPGVMFPFLSAGEKKFADIGFSGFLDAGFNLFDFLNVGPELGLSILPKNNFENLENESDKIVTIVPFGIQVGGYFYPFSRFEIAGGLSAGLYVGVNNERYHYAPWYRAAAEINFRLTPEWSLGINGSWFNCQNNTWFGNPGASGITAGLGVKFKLDSKKALGKIDGIVYQEESVFPLLYTIYKDNSFGTIEITNNESAEIRDVKVYFRSEGYTSSDLECGSIRVVRKQKSVDIPLYADFNESILQFTEEGKIPGELIVEYTLLGKKRRSVSEVIIPVYNRNQSRWTDSSMIASYVSSSAQEVLEFSKSLAGIARGHVHSGMNRNFQFAMYLNEGIRLAGIECGSDKSTPYKSTHLNPDILDYIQYPYQTMMYKTGDCDDIGILYLSLLKSVGIESAFIPLENDFIVAINLEVSAASIGTLFDGYDRVLVVDNQIWIPVAMSSIKEGFINSWYKAVVELQKTVEAGYELDFVNISEAWQTYPPAGFSSGENINVQFQEKLLFSTVETDISRYVTAEFGPQIAAVQERIKKEGASVSLYNQLGMLYVRAGMYSSAIPVFEVSVKAGSTSAMINLGNIASLQKRYEEAKKWYLKALEKDPNNKSAKKNLERIQTELTKDKRE